MSPPTVEGWDRKVEKKKKNCGCWMVFVGLFFEVLVFVWFVFGSKLGFWMESWWFIFRRLWVLVFDGFLWFNYFYLGFSFVGFFGWFFFNGCLMEVVF